MFAAVIAGVIAGRSASAASVTTYTDAGAFTNGLEDFWRNSFSGIMANGVQSNPAVFSGSTSGIYAYSVTASGGLYGWTSGTPRPALTTLVADTPLVFTSFSTGISAFGGRFWGADFFDGSLITGRTVTLTLALSDNSTASAAAIVSSTASGRLFLIELFAGKQLLPWFGGAPGCVGRLSGFFPGGARGGLLPC